MSLNVTQIKSSGVSKVFLLLVMWRGQEYYMSMFKENTPLTQGTLWQRREQVDLWITGARDDMIKGGPGIQALEDALESTVSLFDKDNKSTYWTDSKHFFTWRKNNLERTAKKAAMMADSHYRGTSSNAQKVSSATHTHTHTHTHT
jgi:heme-degrading monooxygenase HmoA